MITILTVGKKHEDWVLAGIERYQKRLIKPWDISWQLLPHSHLQDSTARDEESSRLLARIKPDAYVVLLDEAGTQLDSPALSRLCEQQFTSARPLVFIIGGAYGVNQQLNTRADAIWSLSPLVFPHQLVRLILTEQLYRAQEISRGSKYHHE